MGLEIQVEVIHKETIIPSSPTPSHLTTCNLSVFDQFISDVYVRLLLFYPNSDIRDNQSLFADRSKVLKTSLSAALTRFYPFAGRTLIKNKIVSICCNDQGAAFIETRVNCPISKVLEKPHDLGVLKQLLPTAMESTQESTGGYLLLVQANFFECGGVVIGVSISHKAADASTLGTFISSWAALALGAEVETLPAAKFGVAASDYPQLDFNKILLPRYDYVYEACRSRQFVFSASNIASLRSKAASAKVPDPTRVEVVSALIWKCAMEASRSNSGTIRPSMLVQWANMRKILRKPDLMGNLLGLFTTKIEQSEANDLQSLVAALREGIEKFKAKHGDGVGSEGVCELYKEHRSLVGKKGIDIYNCSSWCRFSFYDADFGWGKPSRVSTPGAEFKNVIVMIDTKEGDGIEVSLSLKEEDMTLMETNQELLAYASLNPSVNL